jgi:hypothetical protein
MGDNGWSKASKDDEGEEVVQGRKAIVADWLEEQDEAGTWEASYRPLVLEGQRAVAEGTTSYTKTASSSGSFGRCAWRRRTDAPSSRGVLHGPAAGLSASKKGGRPGSEATLELAATPRSFFLFIRMLGRAILRTSP